MDGMFARGVTVYHRPEGSTIKVILEKMLEGTSNTKTTQLGNDTFVPHPVEGTSNVKGHYKGLLGGERVGEKSRWVVERRGLGKVPAECVNQHCYLVRQCLVLFLCS
ncbi:hypothetical protein Pmani_008456 [Petrolisthes manimaculis]|uniref:Uncharacterized protein n=1 Tax=Petrolisthes manimaculis TaxID=1843537 RepID=A0AAE1P9B8_9EUCA|nr:hypothetical protein Pmani_023802 [Petrolisthes manimaculis]KAK4320702.1 hypothetical protein Pmani_008456 [Petrolisthes manimaculis]